MGQNNLVGSPHKLREHKEVQGEALNEKYFKCHIITVCGLYLDPCFIFFLTKNKYHLRAKQKFEHSQDI